MCHLRARVIIVTNQANGATLVAAGSQTGTTGGFVYVHVRVYTAFKHVQRQRRKTKTTDSAPDLLKML